jgi:peptide/nickel transport system permease protein
MHVEPATAAKLIPNRSGLRYRALRHKSFVVGAVLSAVLALAALLSLVWRPYPPADIDIPNKLQSPSAAHWLGTDSLGRDIASQLLVGSQNSIVVGVVAVGIGLLLGVGLGLLASAAQASGRGWVEELVMRASDFTFAFPALLTAIMLTAIYGPGLLLSIVAIGIFNVPVFARITRASANTVWARDFVTAARAAGKGPVAITWDHVLPNIASPLIVQASISFATAILAEAALSYLGLGTQPPQPSWGRMLNEAQTQMFQAPLLAVYPGMAIMLSVLGLNLMGDGLRDLLDPKLARQR